MLDRGDQTGDQPEGESRSFADRYRDFAPALHAWASLRIRLQLRA
jgi:hypothetical protein